MRPSAVVASARSCRARTAAKTPSSSARVSAFGVAPMEASDSAVAANTVQWGLRLPGLGTPYSSSGRIPQLRSPVVSLSELEGRSRQPHPIPRGVHLATPRMARRLGASLLARGPPHRSHRVCRGPGGIRQEPEVGQR